MTQLGNFLLFTCHLSYELEQYLLFSIPLENIHSSQCYQKEYGEILRLTLRTTLTFVFRLHHGRELCLDPVNE